MPLNSARTSEALRTRNTRSFTEGPETVRQLISALVTVWAGALVLALVVALFGGVMALIATAMVLLSTLIVGQQVLHLIRAKRDVLIAKDVPILWGLGRLVAWDPVEGVLFLRNKDFAFMDDQLEDGQGGIRCIYPILGDELALRIPLETQTLEFEDEEVLTREYLSVTVRGSIRWQIADLRQFYLQVSRELRATGELADRRKQAKVRAGPDNVDTSTSGKLMTAAIEWLRLLAEERTRTVVSRVSSGLLIAERLGDSLGINTSTSGLDLARLSGIPSAIEGSQEPWRSATETLAQSIGETVSEGLLGSGINLVRVSLQEIKLPPGILQASKDAAQAAYLPLLAERHAAQKRADLAAEVDLLGKETIGAREVVSVAPAFTLVDFLSQFVSKQVGGTAANVASGVAVGSAIAHSIESALPPSRTTQ